MGASQTFELLKLSEFRSPKIERARGGMTIQHEAAQTTAALPSALDDYLFDLRGYIVLRQAVEPELVDDLNHALDGVPQLQPGGWWGNVQRSGSAEPGKGLELQNVVEGGEAFERLIDHPSWINYMRHYAGETDSYVEGLFIDECFAAIRGEGGYLRVHSGGYRKAVRGQYRYADGVFRCAQVNVLVALTDIGPGDGGTLVIPGSHKSNLPHPQAAEFGAEPMDGLVGVVQPELNQGDVLIFTDTVAHGAASRTKTTGERRTVIYRYGPIWGSTRSGYRYSDELLARLTPSRRAILQPIPPRLPPTRDGGAWC
jgi:ectoine hydroxylase-related dioxygenase (phytanoyl-CoA dioxygenase family)